MIRSESGGWPTVTTPLAPGEQGRLVRSHLGRTGSPARPGDEEPAAARARGRFTRNFAVQATAVGWAAIMLAELRLLLHDGLGLRLR